MKSAPKKKTERRWGDGRIEFFPHVQPLQAWVDEGRTLRSYYDSHQDKFTIQYSQFVKHASKFIKQPVFRKKSHAKPSVATERANRPSPPPSSAAVPARTPGAAAFTHNPSADKDDLI